VIIAIAVTGLDAVSTNNARYQPDSQGGVDMIANID
jgi:hypothetical protein